ncbi:MAG: hypothetical protein ACJAWW_001779 [Sulfurimonas sp.]|jgi:hypothetical protein
MDEIQEKYNQEMIEAYIDKPEKTFWYQNSFSKFNINGVDSMKWNWSWWAFFGGAAFLLYRKQYIPALILFIVSILLSFIPIVPLIISILTGGYSTYFVYKGYKTKLAEIERNISNHETRISTMRQIGGYHSWVVWVYIIFVSLAFVGIVSAVIIPAMVAAGVQ